MQNDYVFTSKPISLLATTKAHNKNNSSEVTNNITGIRYCEVRIKMWSFESLCQEMSHEDPVLRIPSHKQADVKQAVSKSVTCGQAVYSVVHIQQYKCSWDSALGKRNH